MLSEGAQRHLRNAPGGQLEAAGLLRDAETARDASAPLPQPSLPPADAVRLPASLEEARHQAEDYVSRIAQVGSCGLGWCEHEHDAHADESS